MEQTLIEVFPDRDSLALAAATCVVSYARRSVKARSRFAVALAGGSTPRQTYAFLAGPPFADLMPWPDTHVFWSDERCVDPSDARSNERMARLALLDHVAIPPGQIHPLRCGAAEYDDRLRESFPLDLVLLGLGGDGHTASLFPGSPALREEERWTTGVFVEGAAGAGLGVEPGGRAGDGPAATSAAAAESSWRVTLTASFINTAAAVVFLVGGAAKAEAVQEVLEGRRDTDRLPAQLIRPEGGELRWLLDDEAAALLSTATRGRSGS